MRAGRKLTVLRLLTLLLFLLVELTLESPVMAQSAGTGSLAGTVEDPSGAAVAKSEISLTSVATAQTRMTETGIDGSFRFALLPPGRYKAKVRKAGFKTAEFSSVTIKVTETTVLDCTLEVGIQDETVTVEAEAEILQTATPTLGTLVSSEDITVLPLTSRNYTQIIDLSTGVSAGVHDATALGKGTQLTSVNGSNPSQNNYQMDGVAINSIASLGVAGDHNLAAGIGIPNPDSIQEFKVQTSTYDASYGRNPGANVNVVTKSGANRIHGTAFEFLRNTVLNGNPFFYNRDNPDSATKKPVLNQNQFGFALGGPVIKDRFFLFGSYQGSRQKNGLSGRGTYAATLYPIPGGDRTAAGFAAALGAANCGFPNAWYFGGANVECDGSNISPVALKILQMKLPDGSYYVPGSGTSDTRRVTYSDPARYKGDQFIINGDFVITPTHTLSTRFFYTRDPQYAELDNTMPGATKTDFYSNHNGAAKLTSFISDAFMNEVRFSIQRNWGDITETFLEGSSPSELGINHVVPDQDRPPGLVISNAFNLFNNWRPAQSLAQHYQIADQIAWVHGRHTLRAGFEWERIHYFSNPGDSRGFLLFGSFNDFLVGGPGNIPYSIMRRGDGPEGSIRHAYRMNNLSAFIQDDWRLSPKLTMNLGLRWEYFGMLSDNYGNMTNIWPELVATVPVPPTGPTASGPGLVGYVMPKNSNPEYGDPPPGVLQADNNSSIDGHPPYTNFGPRIGIAWQPLAKGNVVVRAGFGLFYDRVWADAFNHAAQQNPPYAVSLDYAFPVPNPYTLENPFRDIPLGSFPSRWSNRTCLPDGTECSGATSDLNANFLAKDIRTPQTRQYNVSVQYEFVRDWVIEVAYVGSSSIRLMDAYRNINTARLASASNPINGQTANTLGNVNLRVPFLGFQSAGFTGTEFDGTSNYNSLQTTLRKRFSYGLALQASYTWSKNLTDMPLGSSIYEPFYGKHSNDPDNARQQYGPSSFNRPQRFILNYRYEFPFGFQRGFRGKLLEGWSISGVTTIQGGLPMTFTDNRGGSIYGTSSSRAQLCSDATHSSILTSGDIHSRLGGASGGPGYFNAGAFCEPPTGGIYGDGTGFGNSGIGIAYGPGQFNWDIAVLKNTHIREGHSIQFRAEFYNAFNHTQFESPDREVTSPTFGQILGTSVNPRIIQFGLKYLF